MTDRVVTLSELMQDIGRNMAEHRKISGLTQPELLEEIRIRSGKVFPRRLMSLVESGTIVDILELSAAAMGLDLTDFIYSPSMDFTEKAEEKRTWKAKIQAQTALELVKELLEDDVMAPMDEEVRTKDGYNTYASKPVSENQVEETATLIWEYADGHGWTEEQAEDVLSMIFDDLNW